MSADPAPFLALDFAAVKHWLLAFGLSVARPTAMLTFTPAFTRVSFTGALRGAVASALALPQVPVLAAALSRQDWPALGLVALAGKEALLGFALGLLLGAPFWALDVAGDVLDAQRGATQGRLNDPAGFEDVSITGTLLVMTAVALFVSTGGFDTLTDLLYGSWAIWTPLGTVPRLDGRTPDLLLGFLDRVTRQGLTIALPPVVAMLLADAGLMVVARMASQLRIDDIALALRNIVFLAFLPLYAVFLITFMGRDFGSLGALLSLLRDGMPAEARP